jgi:hypothetical protein
MTNEANKSHQCWSCKEKVAPTDIFCPHCGTEQFASTSANVQVLLKSDKPPQWQTITVVGTLLFFVGTMLLISSLPNGIPDQNNDSVSAEIVQPNDQKQFENQYSAAEEKFDQLVSQLSEKTSIQMEPILAEIDTVRHNVFPPQRMFGWRCVLYYGDIRKIGTRFIRPA